MSNKEVIHTIIGRYHKFEIVRESGKFYIYLDGKYNTYYKGTFSRLDDAVNAVDKEKDRP